MKITFCSYYLELFQEIPSYCEIQEIVQHIIQYVRIIDKLMDSFQLEDLPLLQKQLKIYQVNSFSPDYSQIDKLTFKDTIKQDFIPAICQHGSFHFKPIHKMAFTLY